MHALPLRTFGRSDRGATLVEFGLVAPILIMMLLGLFDLSHELYVKASLQGVVQKAARDSTLQDFSTLAAQQALDAKVTQQVQMLDSQAGVAMTRRYFSDYSQASAKQPEQYFDTNLDGTCDNNESYLDANGNGVWDADGGNGDNASHTNPTPGGGAQDRTIYTVTVTYPRLMPIWKFIGLSSSVTLIATTVLQNQPYADQTTYGAGTWKHCT